MSIADVPLRIVHLSCLHCGEPTFRKELLSAVVERVNGLRPDVILVSGDLTASGYQWEYAQAVSWLERMEAPKIVVPGNHDSRNVGYVHFERHFGPRFSSHRQAFEPARAERIRATGLTVVAVDSSEPDLDEGHIGREWYGWIREQLTEPDDVKIFLIHHHLVPVPGAGRDLNVITDAGDLLPQLTGLGFDMVLTGHKHVPSFWGLNGMLIANAGTAATRRLRGQIPPSWNELQVDASTIKVFMHYPDGRRELSVIRSRTTRSLIREGFYLTEQFFTSNNVVSS